MALNEVKAFEDIGTKGSYFKSQKGNQLYYYNTGGDKSPMLFLHTLRTQGELHHKLLPAFADKYDCYVLDWPGHGRSSRNQKLDYTAEYFVEQAIEFIEAKDLKDLVLVGESIGATASLAIAARVPDRIRSVYASNPFDEGFIIGSFAGKMVSWLGGRSARVTQDEKRGITKFVIGGGFYDRSRLEDRFINLISQTASNDKNYGYVFHSMLANQKTWYEIRKTDYPKIPKNIEITLHYSNQDWSKKWVRKENATRIGGHLKVVESARAGHFSFLENPIKITELILAGERADED